MDVKKLSELKSLVLDFVKRMDSGKGVKQIVVIKKFRDRYDSMQSARVNIGKVLGQLKDGGFLKVETQEPEKQGYIYQNVWFKK